MPHFTPFPFTDFYNDKCILFLFHLQSCQQVTLDGVTELFLLFIFYHLQIFIISSSNSCHWVAPPVIFTIYRFLLFQVPTVATGERHLSVAVAGLSGSESGGGRRSGKKWWKGVSKWRWGGVGVKEAYGKWWWREVGPESANLYYSLCAIFLRFVLILTLWLVLDL